MKQSPRLTGVLWGAAASALMFYSFQLSPNRDEMATRGVRLRDTAAYVATALAPARSTQALRFNTSHGKDLAMESSLSTALPILQQSAVSAQLIALDREAARALLRAQAARVSAKEAALAATRAAIEAQGTAQSEPLKPGLLSDHGPSRPRNAILMAAAGMSASDLRVALASIAEHAPSVSLLMVVQPDQVLWLSAFANETRRQGGKPRLWLRLYDWNALHNRLASDYEKTLFPAIRRYHFYDMVLRDIAPDKDGVMPAPTGAPGPVLFSNFDAEHLLAPHAVFLADSRDLVFQADPFPDFWAFVARHGANPSAPPPAPLKPDLFDSRLAAEVAILVAGEARVSTLGEDDWNRGWVSWCFFDLGEAMVNSEQIYCSGTTFGTINGLRTYLRNGMLPAMRFCAKIDFEKGMDQGIHNVLLHRYSKERLDGWRANARAGGLYRPGGGTEMAMAQPLEFLTLVDTLQDRLTVHVAHAEDGLICTMALLLRNGVHQAEDGAVLPSRGSVRKCAVVHQFDRDAGLVTHFKRLYGA